VSYDYDYYSGRDLTYPKRPSRPSALPRNATAAEVRDYADQLEFYEAELESYKDVKAYYNETINRRTKELQTKLRDDYDITEAQLFVLWNKAWEDGHSEGFQRVVGIFDDLYDLASEFAALEKK
jgi:hypothetical protein